MTADELDIMNWTTRRARDVLAAIFETGFQRAHEGRPYDYADEIIRRLHEAGFVINPVLTDDQWIRQLEDASGQVDLLRDLLTWHATPAFEEGHNRVLVLTDDGKEEPGDKCWFCDEPWPCPTEQAWTALHPEEAS